MTPQVLVKTTQLSYEDWLKWRKKGIGSSDSAIVCGLSPWRSPFSLWLDKVGEMPPQEETFAMKMGHVLEPVVASLFQEQTGFRVKRRNAILQHPTYPFMLANLDRLTHDGTGWVPFECKTTAQWNEDAWENGAVPDFYQVQVQHQMAVTGSDHAWIAVLIGGNRFIYVRLERDPDVIKTLIAMEQEFWHLVETGTAPAIDGKASTTEMLNMQFRSAEAESPEVWGDVETLQQYHDYWALDRQITTLEESKAAIANTWRLQLGGAEALYAPGLDKPIATWKKGQRTTFDTKAFAADHPDLREQYTKTIETRSLRPRPLKKEDSNVRS